MAPRVTVRQATATPCASRTRADGLEGEDFRRDSLAEEHMIRRSAKVEADVCEPRFFAELHLGLAERIRRMMDAALEQASLFSRIENVASIRKCSSEPGTHPRPDVAIETAVEIADLGFDRSADAHLPGHWRSHV